MDKVEKMSQEEFDVIEGLFEGAAKKAWGEDGDAYNANFLEKAMKALRYFCM